MTNSDFNPRALFLSSDGTLYSDSLICSGLLPAKLGGKPCPFAHNKHMPKPQPLNSKDDDYELVKGKPGELCPPCAVLHVGALDRWEEHEQYHFAEELLPLRLFQCRQAFWLIVPGLYDDEATRLIVDEQVVDDEEEENGDDRQGNGHEAGALG